MGHRQHALYRLWARCRGRSKRADRRRAGRADATLGRPCWLCARRRRCGEEGAPQGGRGRGLGALLRCKFGRHRLGCDLEVRARLVGHHVVRRHADDRLLRVVGRLEERERRLASDASEGLFDA